MIPHTNAIVQPRAVMVKSLHAAIADCTVSGAGRAQDETVRAHVSWMQLGEKLEEVMLWT